MDMKKNTNFIFFIFIVLLNFCVAAQSHPGNHIKKLMDGNHRFYSGETNHPNQSLDRVRETSSAQKPFAVILTCSDSRVPPEIIFDQGIGDLFVVRTAGQVVDDIALGSIEYAVEHLGVKLIVVLGHERCGAVQAAVKGGEAEGHIPKLIESITPSVEKAKMLSGDLLDNSILFNVIRIVAELKSSKPILEEFIHNKELEIVGAIYDLDEGKVRAISTPTGESAH